MTACLFPAGEKNEGRLKPQELQGSSGDLECLEATDFDFSVLLGKVRACIILIKPVPLWSHRSGLSFCCSQGLNNISRVAASCNSLKADHWPSFTYKSVLFPLRKNKGWSKGKNKGWSKAHHFLGNWKKMFVWRGVGHKEKSHPWCTHHIRVL